MQPKMNKYFKKEKKRKTSLLPVPRPALGKIPAEFGDWEQSEPVPYFPDVHPLRGPLHPRGVGRDVYVTRQGWQA